VQIVRVVPSNLLAHVIVKNMTDRPVLDFYVARAIIRPKNCGGSPGPAQRLMLESESVYADAGGTGTLQAPGRQGRICPDVFTHLFGGEEFTNNLKTLNRATIIGETTGGGTHPVRGHRRANCFEMQLATNSKKDGAALDHVLLVPQSRQRINSGRSPCRRIASENHGA
jgi:hypothetical protein